MTSFDTKLIPGITPQQWQRLRELLDGRERRVLEPAQLRSACGMHLSDAVKLIAALCNSGSAISEWMVFHGCSEHPVELLSEPCVVLPWTCPDCEEDVAERGVIRAVQRCVLTESVVFV